MMTANRKNRSRGSAIIEFTFVGIPLIFVLISIVEGARGMWIYTTMAHAIKEGTRYAIVHGSAFHTNCLATNPADPAVCNQADGQNVAQAILNAGPGLIDTEVINVAFSVNGGTSWQSCPGAGTLHDCITNGSSVTFPAAALASMGTFSVRAQYRFASAISMFWPGAGRGITFGTFNLPASSQDTVQF